ncbi:hypothetical protein WJX81_006093 [Elliptochloris bilobata]|uniref:Thaumatin-like protein n=1 Tax=Elliptochloris bilobata TaxID=381761 RepID=A0AAW1QXW0_9CHLO
MLCFAPCGSLPSDAPALHRYRVFTIVNACNYTVWPSTRSNMPVAGGGFELPPGARMNISVPDGWIGSWSPRTGCAFDALGKGSCEVGDCGGFLACDQDAGLMPPNVTTAEFSLNSWGGMDYYDVVLTYSTVPMLLKPSDPACIAGGCLSDPNAHCETAQVDGRMLSAAGAQVGCMSACAAYNDAERCLRSTPYSERQKRICPVGAYTYFNDNATLVCTGRPDYQVIFCGYLEP